MPRNALFCAASALFLSLAPAHAQDVAAEPEVPALTLSGEAALVSDYRFRGLSYTNIDPAVQVSVTLTHESGVYGNIWSSNLSDTPLYGEVELDFSGGWAGTIAPGGILDIGGGYYTYPNGDPAAGRANFGEIYARYTQTVGPVSAMATLAYAAKMRSLGKADSLYYAADLNAAVPSTPLSFTGHIGRTEGALAPGGSYADWSLGAMLALGRTRFGIAWIDTDIAGLRTAKSGVVGTAKIIF